MTAGLRVCILGAGNWGSAIAKVIGPNCATLQEFDETITMYVHEEMIEYEKLSDIINTKHENVRYLPGFKLPLNLKATPNLLEAATNADILIFVVPHSVVPELCTALEGKLKPNAIAVSLIKGFDKPECGDIELTSHYIRRRLKIPCSVMVGANLAKEVANDGFCETNLGYQNIEQANLLQLLFQTHNFRVIPVNDVDAVEVCAALKNIVGCAAGFVDGNGMGDNTKAAVIRLGLMEMIHFVEEFLPNSKLSTFFESCGLGDLIATCYGGRTRMVAEAFAKMSKAGRQTTFKELQKELLHGLSLQGPATAATVAHLCEKKGVEGRFPLFMAVHEICTHQIMPEKLISRIMDHPEYRKLF